MTSKKYNVKGIVQGVFFRKSTADYVQTNLPAIIGYVKNLPDGSVEVYAKGSDSDLVTLEEYLSHGPEMARVDELTQEFVDLGIEFKSFDVLRE
jgi:acylphosphatase